MRTGSLAWHLVHGDGTEWTVDEVNEILRDAYRERYRGIVPEDELEAELERVGCMDGIIYSDGTLLLSTLNEDYVPVDFRSHDIGVEWDERSS